MPLAERQGQPEKRGKGGILSLLRIAARSLLRRIGNGLRQRPAWIVPPASERRIKVVGHAIDDHGAAAFRQEQHFPGGELQHEFVRSEQRPDSFAAALALRYPVDVL